MDEIHTMLFELILGGYAFAAGAYIFVWAIYKIVSSKLEKFEKNHLAHITADIRALRRVVNAHIQDNH